MRHSRYNLGVLRMIAVSLILFGAFCLRHYSYLGLALLFFGCLTIFYSLSGIRNTRFHRFVNIIRPLVTAVFVIGLSYFLVVESVILVDAYDLSTNNADYIIVLGAAVDEDSPSPDLQNRLEYAFDYLTEHPNCRAILTGGNETGQTITEAECMFVWLSEQGIPAHRLIIEPQATSTMENFIYSAELIQRLTHGKSASIGIVTSEYHVHRAKYLASACGLDAFGIPAKTNSFPHRVNNFIREVFGMTYYYVFGADIP